MSGDLTLADFALHANLAIPEDLLARAGVRRVSDVEQWIAERLEAAGR